MLYKRAFNVMIVALAVVLFAGVYSKGRAQESNTIGRCVVVVPQGWGEFLSASQYGLVFKDKEGTLRFVSRMPCGLEGSPNVSLEVRRK